MPEKNSHLAALPGYGMLAVILTILFGIASARKEGEKKPAPAPAQPPPGMTPKGNTPSNSTFLKEMRLAPTVASGTKFLILTLPDPIQSQLGYWHDQSIDALTRAMGDLGDPKNTSHGYVLSGRWFSWTIAPQDKSKSPVPRTGSSSPEFGVVVYSKNDNADDRKVVLVVGEDPTTGVRVEDLKAALGFAAQAQDGTAIPLVGPFFTGSQVSLARALQEWADERKNQKRPSLPVRCVTGTALGLKPWDQMLPEKAAGLSLLCGPITGTQVPFEQLNQVALHYLSKPGRTTPADPLGSDLPDGKVAYLVEANSGLGEAVAGSARRTKNNKHLIFRFPMHIGRLAGIRSKEARERDERLGLIKPGESLLATLDETRTGGDVVPAADETRTALINKRLLDDYWFTIRRERVRYVFVVATDARDVLFLLEQIQTACPEAQPVTFTADLHYVYPDYQPFMRGVMIVGNYPLYQPAQRWPAAEVNDRRRLPFPSSNAEGVYNAVLASLGSSERMLDYLPPRFGPPGSGKPPIWVTAVGENGEFVPLAYFTEYGDDDFPVKAEISNNQAETLGSPFTRRFLYLVGLVLVAVVVGVSQVREVDRRTQTEVAEGAIAVWAAGLRAQYVLLAGIGGVFATLPLGLAFWSAPRVEGSLAERTLFVVVLLLLAIIPAGTFWSVCRQCPLPVAGLASQGASGASLQAILRPWQVVAFVLLSCGVVFGWLFADYSCLAERALFLGVLLLLALIPTGTFWSVYRQWRLTAAGLASQGPSSAPPQAILGPWQVVAFLLLICGVVFGWLLADHSRLADAARALFAERAGNLFTGCSPVVPASVIALGLMGYGLLGLERVRLMTEFRVDPPYPSWEMDPPAGISKQDEVFDAVRRAREAAGEIDTQFRSIAGAFIQPGEGTTYWWARLIIWGTAGAFALVAIVLAVLVRPIEDGVSFGLGLAVAGLSLVCCGVVLAFVWKHERRAALGRPRSDAALLVILVGAVCAVALYRSQRTWESQAWNCLFATGLLALAFLTLVAGYRLYLLCKQVEKITRAIMAIPMVGAFDRFPDKVSRVFGAYLLSARRRSLDLAIPVHLLRQLRAVLYQPHACDAPQALAAFQTITAPAQIWTEGPDELHGRDATALAQVAARLVSILAPGWEGRPLPEGFGTVLPEPGKEPVQTTEWRGLAEQFVAIMAVIFLSQFLAQMRYLCYMAVTAAASLLIAITAYQFEPERLLMNTAVGFAGAVILLVVWVLYRINRNELISRVTRTTPDKFQPDMAFVQNLIVFVLPLLIVVVTQVAGRMRSVVEPVLGWLR